LVNERHGVSLLSENTGAHEELGEFSLSVNPLDVQEPAGAVYRALHQALGESSLSVNPCDLQEQADAMYRALTMSSEERSWRAEGLKKIVTHRHPGAWVEDRAARLGGRA